MLANICRILVICLSLACALSVQAGSGLDVVVGDFSNGCDARGIPNGWELKERAGRADLQMVKDGDQSALQMRCTNSSFSIQRSIKADVKQTPFLTWKWKVNRLPEGGDFRHSKSDDQAAQLFVAFSRTRAIVYIWDSSAPEGLMGDAPSPPFMSIKAVVVRSSKNRLGEWLTETRNVYDDYKKLFGDTDKTPVVCGVRLQINTQHTQTFGECLFADVAFQANGRAGKFASVHLKNIR